MCIEHRWAARQPAALPVSLASRSLGLLRGRLRNISSGGALVQAPASLRPNAPVEVILPAHPAVGTRPYRLPAIVTRCDQNGVGLMFERVEPAMWVALQSQLVPPRARAEASADEAAAAGVAAQSLG